MAVSTQNQALNALLFLHRDVLGAEWDEVTGFDRAQEPKRLPVVLTQAEGTALLDEMHGPNGLVAHLLYGAGLRLSEALCLRVNDLDVDYEQITVRQGNGKKDRRTLLPDMLEDPLRRQLRKSRALWRDDREAGTGAASMPKVLAHKYPNAAAEWGWQYVFPSVRRSEDPRSGRVKRHYRSPSAVQKAVKRAVRAAGIAKSASPHTLRPERSEEVVSDCTTPSPRTSWNRARTSARCRSCWATRTSARHRSTRTCSGRDTPARKARFG